MKALRKKTAPRTAARMRRHRKVRRRVTGSAERPRLVVFRSLGNVYAQVIDDVRGATLVQASSLEKGAPEGDGKIGRSKFVGKAIAERSREAGISTVTFDRNGYLYHGRVKALAEAARENGLEF